MRIAGATLVACIALGGVIALGCDGCLTETHHVYQGSATFQSSTDKWSIEVSTDTINHPDEIRFEESYAGPKTNSPIEYYSQAGSMCYSPDAVTFKTCDLPKLIKTLQRMKDQLDKTTAENTKDNPVVKEDLTKSKECCN